MNDQMKPVFGSQPRHGSMGREGLVLDLPLNEGGGNIIKDYSLNDNNGTYNGAVWVAGEHGPALLFDGSTATVSLGTGPSLEGFQKFTIIAKIKTTQASDGKIISQRNGGYNGIWQLGVNGGKAVIFLRSKTFVNYTLASTGDVDDGLWHTVVVTYDQDIPAIYIDGTLDKLSSTSGHTVEFDGSISTNLGCDARASNDYFAGDLGYLTLINRALSAREVWEATFNPWKDWQKDNLLWMAAAQGGGVTPTGQMVSIICT